MVDVDRVMLKSHVSPPRDKIFGDADNPIQLGVAISDHTENTKISVKLTFIGALHKFRSLTEPWQLRVGLTQLDP
jgi:hypothetical protein